jgi:SWI/SNF-related matrix-associated actin-dependent regulator of chromatin subfamily A3
MGAPKRTRESTALHSERPAKQARSASSSNGVSSSQSSVPPNSQSSQPYQPNSTPPSSFGSSGPHGTKSSRATAGVGDADDDDDDGRMEIIDLTQNDSTSSQMEFYGTLENKIVGVRYYNGVVTPGETVLCRREAGNQYDKNAVRIDNVMRQQIGHLPRNLVAKLAPYIDRDEVVLEGVLTGDKGLFDCPVRLYIYGTSDPPARRDLENRLKDDKLLKATQLKATRAEAEARKKAADLGLKSGTSAAGLNAMDLEEQNASLDMLLQSSEVVDTRADADMLKDFAMDEAALSKLPMAQQPKELLSQLLPYQLQVSVRR